jgi:cell cycle checkpoint protein
MKLIVLQDTTGWRAGGWSKTDMVLELGGILKAKDASHTSSSFKPPPVHKLFSKFEFVRGGSSVHAQKLEELSIAEAGQYFEEDETLYITRSMTKEQQGGWLDSDDIEDFD